MKVSKESVSKLINALLISVRKGSVKSEPVDGMNMLAHYLDDLTIIFNNGASRTFFGITVDVLGRTFHISADFTVMLEDLESNDPEERVYTIEDERIIEFLNNYFALRADLLEKLGA